MTICRKLLVAWQQVAPCECRRDYVLSLMLVLLAKVYDRDGVVVEVQARSYVPIVTFKIIVTYHKEVNNCGTW